MLTSQTLLSAIAQVFRPSQLSSNRTVQLSIALLRVVAGIVMVHNGLDKLGNVESFAAAYVAVIGLPFPIFFTYVAAFTELLAAPLLAIGFLTRPAALGLFATMVVAMYHHIKVAGLSIPYLELSALYAACFQYFLIAGAGLFSVDAIIAGWIDLEMGDRQRHAIAAQPPEEIAGETAAQR